MTRQSEACRLLASHSWTNRGLIVSPTREQGTLAGASGYNAAELLVDQKPAARCTSEMFGAAGRLRERVDRNGEAVGSVVTYPVFWGSSLRPEPPKNVCAEIHKPKGSGDLGSVDFR